MKRAIITAALCVASLGASAQLDTRGLTVGQPMNFCPRGWAAEGVGGDQIGCFIDTGRKVSMYFSIYEGRVEMIGWSTRDRDAFDALVGKLVAAHGAGRPAKGRNGLVWSISSRTSAEAHMRGESYHVALFATP